MCRNIDFRNDEHMALRGISDHLTDLVLGIEPAIALVSRFVRGRQCFVGPAPCPDLRKFWVPLDFDAPTIVIRQMPMKHIELMKGEIVEVPLYERDVEEMARDIQVHARPAKAGIILDLNTWNRAT